jgi:hypothetical protein
VARKNRVWLTLDRTIPVYRLERIAEVDDDFRSAVGQDGLRGRRQIVHLPAERPDAAKDIRKPRRRRVFRILHGAAGTLACVSHSFKRPFLGSG